LFQGFVRAAVGYSER